MNILSDTCIISFPTFSGSSTMSGQSFSNLTKSLVCIKNGVLSMIKQMPEKISLQHAAGAESSSTPVVGSNVKPEKNLTLFQKIKIVLCCTSKETPIHDTKLNEEFEKSSEMNELRSLQKILSKLSIDDEPKIKNTVELLFKETICNQYFVCVINKDSITQQEWSEIKNYSQFFKKNALDLIGLYSKSQHLI